MVAAAVSALDTDMVLTGGHCWKGLLKWRALTFHSPYTVVQEKKMPICQEKEG